GMTGTAADVEQCLADAEAGAPPGVERARPPDAVLEPERGDLAFPRAQDVVPPPARAAHAPNDEGPRRDVPSRPPRTSPTPTLTLGDLNARRDNKPLGTP